MSGPTRSNQGTRRSQQPEDMYGNFDDYLDRQMDYDDEGRVVTGTDPDDEEEERSEEEYTKVDVGKTAAAFNEKRSGIKVPIVRKGRPTTRTRAKRQVSESPPRKREPRGRQEKRETRESSEESYDERYPDGGRELDDYFRSEAKDTRR